MNVSKITIGIPTVEDLEAISRRSDRAKNVKLAIVKEDHHYVLLWKGSLPWSVVRNALSRYVNAPGCNLTFADLVEIDQRVRA